MLATYSELYTWILPLGFNEKLEVSHLPFFSAFDALSLYISYQRPWYYDILKLACKVGLLHGAAMCLEETVAARSKSAQ